MLFFDWKYIYFSRGKIICEKIKLVIDLFQYFKDTGSPSSSFHFSWKTYVLVLVFLLKMWVFNINPCAWFWKDFIEDFGVTLLVYHWTSQFLESLHWYLSSLLANMMMLLSCLFSWWNTAICMSDFSTFLHLSFTFSCNYFYILICIFSLNLSSTFFHTLNSDYHICSMGDFVLLVLDCILMFQLKYNSPHFCLFFLSSVIYPIHPFISILNALPDILASWSFLLLSLLYSILFLLITTISDYFRTYIRH